MVLNRIENTEDRKKVIREFMSIFSYGPRVNCEKKKIMFVDSADFLFNIFFRTRKYYLCELAKKKINLDKYTTEKYRWDQDEIFTGKLLENIRKCFEKLMKSHGISVENIFLMRDCPRDKNWRKEVFPKYKGNRTNIITHSGSLVNVSPIFNYIYSKIITQLMEEYGFHLIKVDHAEADDIIGVLTHYYANKYQIVIISSDNDYLQLLVHREVSIYNCSGKNMADKLYPRSKEISRDELSYRALIYLLEKIFGGDRSDNISPLCDKNQIRYFLTDPGKFEEKIRHEPQILEKFLKNKHLIDFMCIRDDIKEKILKEFQSYFGD